MNEADFGALTAAVDDGLESDEDFEYLWNQLGEAITASPSHPGLRRLRIRLADAANALSTHIADLTALRDLDPADRDAWLDLAVLQHRWAYRLSDEDDGESDMDEDDSECDDIDGESESIDINIRVQQDNAVNSPQAVLQQQALQWLTELIATYRSDADFCVNVFARWSDASIYAPWLRLRLALEVSAAHPHDMRLERVLAGAWADLANQSPEGFGEGMPLPTGFLVDVFGNLWDPFMIDRAEKLYDGLIRQDPQDADLLSNRARLRQASYAFDAAATDYEAAAEVIEVAAHASVDDAEREAMRISCEELRMQAQQCRGGREALVNGGFDGMDEAMAKLLQPKEQRPGASEEAQAFLREWEQSSQEHFQSLASELGAFREQLSSTSTGPDETALAEMGQVATNVAGSVISTIQLAPIDGRQIESSAFEDDWETRLEGVLAALRAHSWRALGWVEWPSVRPLIGHQALSSVWIDPATCAVVLASPVKHMVIVDIETELEDGRQVVTTLSRGRSFMVCGSEVEMLFIEPTLPIEEACAIHNARVAWMLSRSPEASLRRLSTIADVVDAQERARQVKVRFRLQNGLTTAEALGLPCDYPEVFVPMVQEAVSKGISALRANTSV